ncbi:MAG TPA: hypothetical protein VD866_10985 [Urbifossiella sp.]|nr:hypothetical protein [Urbifossiella sp.]
MPKPADEPMKTLRVVIDEDLAAVIQDRCQGKKRGAETRLVNLTIRQQFEQLGWIDPLLKPSGRHDASDDGK